MNISQRNRSIDEQETATSEPDADAGPQESPAAPEPTTGPESASAPAAPRVEGRRSAWLIAGGYVLLILVLLVTVAVLLAQRTTGWPLHPQLTSHAVEQARTDAVRSGSEDAVALLSYDYRTVDDELKKARENITGPFLDDYTKLTTTVVAPAARDQSITTKAVVVGAAVESASPTHVVTLLFINQTTTTKSAPEPSQSGSRVTLAMDKVGDRWLVSALTPV